jgi:hypothetical protein
MLGIIWLATKILINLAFQNRPGGLAEFQLLNNLKIIFQPVRVLKVVPFYLGYFLLIKHEWPQKPQFLRRAFLLGFVPLAFFFMVVGVLDELRIYYEVFPLVVLLSLPSFVEIFDREQNFEP